ncbi:DUF4392 domain-containing protein [Paramaledivibacter caminithermalis]|jgi:hypothetical protein|uniref:D-glutamate cyclase-like C-terminal domain-containing protein n=1 Tax=Paramaledivibacter caminithermalis (strain DSM 15212 / CIP 107654 / DViRD3) TaxID=1121301 RepID=A0A1M6PH90_PARC5|nr:DUF4392 domain-containing protein [Paramaledivibacter caminithermalis]SHK07260.1 protein of unknown function [Paramaledivibacter caminithermalis DSM 15212]
MNRNYFKEIENIIKKNLEQRGMGKINLIGELEKGAMDLVTSSTILIVTGFVIRDTLTGETDGPIGAISLSSALKQLGKKVILVTDIYSQDIMYSCCLAKGITVPIEIIPCEEAEEFCNNLLQKYKPSHIVAIERPGRAKDGRCYSMRGEDLSDIVPNTDILFERAKELRIATLAVGDGGNEIGMGKVSDFVINSVDKGEKICAVISTDYLIVAGVSNWGGHALVAALSLLTNRMLLHDSKTEKQILESMIKVGAVDGCTKKSTLSVDGLSLEDNIEILEGLRNIVYTALKTLQESKLYIG